MKLEISDTRNNQKGILWESLEAGCIYIDKSGWYVMAIDMGAVLYLVDLSDGMVPADDAYERDYDTFIPVKAKLEIFG